MTTFKQYLPPIDTLLKVTRPGLPTCIAFASFPTRPDGKVLWTLYDTLTNEPITSNTIFLCQDSGWSWEFCVEGGPLNVPPYMLKGRGGRP